MIDVQPDPTDTGTSYSAPTPMPLQKKGNNFIPIDIPEFETYVMHLHI